MKTGKAEMLEDRKNVKDRKAGKLNDREAEKLKS
jgi:hypothetical protein